MHLVSAIRSKSTDVKLLVKLLIIIFIALWLREAISLFIIFLKKNFRDYFWSLQSTGLLCLFLVTHLFQVSGVLARLLPYMPNGCLKSMGLALVLIIELNITGRLPPLFFMKPKFARLYRVSGGKVSHNLASFAISSRDHCGREAKERASRVCCVYFLVLIRSFSLVPLWNQFRV